MPDALSIAQHLAKSDWVEFAPRLAESGPPSVGIGMIRIAQLLTILGGSAATHGRDARCPLAEICAGQRNTRWSVGWGTTSYEAALHRAGWGIEFIAWCSNRCDPGPCLGAPVFVGCVGWQPHWVTLEGRTWDGFKQRPDSASQSADSETRCRVYFYAVEPFFVVSGGDGLRFWPQFRAVWCQIRPLFWATPPSGFGFVFLPPPLVGFVRVLCRVGPSACDPRRLSRGIPAKKSAGRYAH